MLGLVTPWRRQLYCQLGRNLKRQEFQWRQMNIGDISTTHQRLMFMNSQSFNRHWYDIKVLAHIGMWLMLASMEWVIINSDINLAHGGIQEITRTYRGLWQVASSERNIAHKYFQNYVCKMAAIMGKFQWAKKLCIYWLLNGGTCFR